MKVNEAERQVAAILRQLEIDSDSYVENIEVVSIDETCMQDDRPTLVQLLRINLKRKPGTRWGQAGE